MYNSQEWGSFHCNGHPLDQNRERERERERRERAHFSPCRTVKAHLWGCSRWLVRKVCGLKQSDHLILTHTRRKARQRRLNMNKKGAFSCQAHPPHRDVMGQRHKRQLSRGLSTLQHRQQVKETLPINRSREARKKTSHYGDYQREGVSMVFTCLPP